MLRLNEDDKKFYKILVSLCIPIIVQNLISTSVNVIDTVMMGNKELYDIMKEKDSNLLVVRQIMNTHRDSTFAQLQWAQQKLGVSKYWKNTRKRR